MASKTVEKQKSTEDVTEGLIRQASQPMEINLERGFGEWAQEAEERLMEKYSGVPTEALETAATEANQRLRQISAELAKADETLAEASAADAKLFATAGEGARFELPNFTEAQRRIAELGPRAWMAEKAATELTIAYKSRKITELEAESEGVHKEVVKAEEAYRVAEDYLNTLRWQHRDVVEEMNGTRAGWKQMFSRYGELLRGPQLQGLARFLLTGK